MTFNSCTDKQDNIKQEVFKLTQNTKIINVENIVQDINAIGLSQAWFEYKKFPLSLLSNKIIDTNVPYIWYCFDMIFDPDSLQPAFFLNSNDENQLLCWVNGDKIELEIKNKFLYPKIEFGNHDTVNIILRQRVSKYPSEKIKLITQIEEKISKLVKVPMITFTNNKRKTPKLIYKIFLRNFTRNGTFNGLENRLPYIKNLGVDALLLMPFHPQGEFNDLYEYSTPYSVKRHYSTNPDMGSKEQFTQMVNVADSMGITFYQEAVLDRTSRDHLYTYKQRNMYQKDSRGDLISPNEQGVLQKDLALLNTRKSDYPIFVYDYISYWENTANIKGFLLVNSSSVYKLNETSKTVFNNFSDIDMISDFDPGDTDSHDKHGLMNINNEFVTILSDVAHGSRNSKSLHTLLELESKLKSTSIHYIENAGSEKAIKIFGKSLYPASFLTMILPGIPMIYSGQELKNVAKMELTQKTTVNWRNEDKIFNNIIAKSLKEKIYPTKNNPIILTPLNKDLNIFACKIQNNKNSIFIYANFSDKTVAIELLDKKIVLTDEKSIYNNQLIKLSAYGYILAK
ncbi:MAG: hypothetical protein KAI81_09485 [Candidatus Marinimicrobia bacterium]|nr:hypothetical protein [Candidatus Neomarinimicrobiota bacterium]